MADTDDVVVPSIVDSEGVESQAMTNPVRNDRPSSPGLASVSSTVDIEVSGDGQGRRPFLGQNDRTPLLRQIRLFQSLSGGDGNIMSPNGSAGIVEGFNSVRTLTTFSGVFTPVCLSMFSAILFLRVGYILGHSGLLLTLLEMVMAYSILFFTVLSICAVSTNGAIEGGGAYFMISRALGPEFGGAIGTLFFIANIFSSALYLTGCVEGVISNFGPSGSISQTFRSGQWWDFLYGSSLNLFNTTICLIGAALFAKTSAVIFFTVMGATVTVMLSLLLQSPMAVDVPEENFFLRNQNITSVNFTSFSWPTFKDNLLPHWGVDYTTSTTTTFAIVFGVMFSGVTGIMAGANMSGELKDPGQSIPKGTLGAIGFTFVTYVMLFFLTAATCPFELLQNVNLYMQPTSLWPPIVAIGLFAATLSAALSNLIGASRVLEALVKDNLFGKPLSWLSRFSLSGNPIGAVLCSFVLVEFVLLIGSLNRIAQITSTFFLISYFSTNLACFALTLTSAPNFRPSFKYFSATTTLIGMMGCLSMMFLISPLYALYVITSCLILVIGLHLRSPPVRWGSISQALIFHQVRKYLLLLDSRKDHVKYWRPQFLLMIANPRSCLPLIDFVNDLKKSGLFVLGHVRLGNMDHFEMDPCLQEYPLWLKLVDKLKVKAFIELTMSNSVREGLHQLGRCAGLGAMKPNTILFGFYDDTPPEDFFQKDQTFHAFLDERIRNEPFLPLRETQRKLTRDEYVAMIYDSIFRLQKNVCLARNFHLFRKAQLLECRDTNFIDIWPLNFFDPHNNSIDNCWLFMMQLACILHMVPGWKKSTSVRVFMCVDSKVRDASVIHRNWEQMLQMLRIDATIHVVIWDHVTSPLTTSGDLSVQFADTGAIQDDVSSGIDDSFRSRGSTSTERRHFPFNPHDENFLKNVNTMVQEHSNSTAVVFMYLPVPSSEKKDRKNYLQQLDTLTANLPPTLLVHGISPVTSITL